MATQKHIFLVKNWLRQHWSVAVLFIVSLVALGLRLYHLDYPSLTSGYDEGWSFINSAYPLNLIIPRLWVDHSPLFFYLAHFYIDLTNYTHDSVILRLVAVILGVATVWATYLLAQTLLNNRKLAMLTAVITAIAPFSIIMSRSFRMYPLFILLSIFSSYFLLKALRNNKLYNWAFFVIASSLNTYTHYDAIFIMLLLGIFGLVWSVVNLLLCRFVKDAQINSEKGTHVANASATNIWLRWRKAELGFNYRQIWWRVLFGAVSFALIFVLYLPWLPHLFTFVDNSSFGISRTTKLPPASYPVAAQFTDQVLFAYDARFWLGFIVAMVGSIWLLYRRFYFGLFCLCYFWGTFLILSQLPHTDYFVIQPRYYSFVLPIYLVMLAAGVEAIGLGLIWVVGKLAHTVKKSVTVAAQVVVAVAILSLIVVQSLQGYSTNQVYDAQRTAVDDMADFLSHNLQPADTVMVATPLSNATPFTSSYLLTQLLAFLMSSDSQHESAVWAHFTQLEQLDSYTELTHLQTTHANSWLMAFVSDTDTNRRALEQRIKAVDGKRFVTACFNVDLYDMMLCAIGFQPANFPANQYSGFQTLLQSFSFVNDQFAKRSQFMASLNLSNPQSFPVANGSAIYTLSSKNPTYVALPTKTKAKPQYFVANFEYQGSPSGVFAGPQNSHGQNILPAPIPSWSGYMPPPPLDRAPQQWSKGSLVFEAPPNTDHTILAFLGQDGPAKVTQIQLLQLQSP